MIRDAILLSERFEFAGFIVEDFAEGKSERAFIEDLETQTAVIVGVGDNFQRDQISQRFSEVALVELVTLIHPTAVLAADVVIGAGTFVAAGAIINTEAKIGRNVIINTGAIIEHDCQLADSSSIAPGACLGGGAQVGLRTAVGIGAVVNHRVIIGSDTVIGSGAVVVKDIPAAAIAYGIPATLKGTREPGQPYL